MNEKKKRIKPLTEDYYEKLLMTEMKLKKDFSMETLQEVVELYAVLIYSFR
jgi:hypothetical protein